MNKNGIESKKDVFDRISDLIEQARRKVATTINEEMLLLYWNIGKVIKEQIMKSDRAEYGKQIVQSLTAQLVPRYGRGFSKRNLWYMIQLYEAYPILQSLLGEFNGLSWTHIINILPIKDKLKREFYANLLMKELEGRTDLRYIQELLGHKRSKTPIQSFFLTGQATEVYTHVSRKSLGLIKSPLDTLLGEGGGIGDG